MNNMNNKNKNIRVFYNKMKSVSKNLKLSLNNKITLIVLGVLILILLILYFCVGKYVENMSSGSPLVLEKKAVSEELPEYIKSVSFSKSGNVLVNFSVKNNTVYVLNPENGSVLKTFQMASTPLISKTFTMTEEETGNTTQYLAVSDISGNFKIIHLDADVEVLTTNLRVNCMDSDPSGRNLIVGTTSGEVININLPRTLESGMLNIIWTKTFGEYRHNKHIYSLAITDDGSSVIVGSKDSVFRVLTVDGGFERYSEKVLGRVTCVGINPIRNESGNIVFGICVSGTPVKIMMYQLDYNNKCEKIKTINHNTNREMNEIMFFENKYLITGGNDTKVSVFNINTGKLEQSVDMGSNNFIDSMSISPNMDFNGSYKLAVGSYKTRLSLFDLRENMPEFGSDGSNGGFGGGDGGGGAFDTEPSGATPP